MNKKNQFFCLYKELLTLFNDGNKYKKKIFK